MLRSGTYTVCFTDLRGSTELRVRVGDVEFDELRRRHDQLLAEAIDASGGHLVKSMGDGVLAVFAGAVPALDAAIAMQHAIEVLNRSLRTPLDLAVGISAGDVAIEGDDVHGTPVVEAARLCAVARAGQVLAADVVRVLAGSRGAHRFEPMGDLSLKGLVEPVRTFEVLWTPSSGAGSAASWCAPEVAALARAGFVGRSAEHDQLTALWKTAATGTTACAFVSGEPGIGKTRLTVQVAATAHAAGATALFGGCDDGAGVAFQPWARALGVWCAAVDADALAAHLGPLGGELTRIVPSLAARVPGLGAPLLSDPESDRLRLFEAVTELLGSIGREAPVVLVLDDVHWADAPSLLLLRHVLRASARPLLVMATYRDTELDRTHPLSTLLTDLRRSDLARVERVGLSGLAADDVRAFVQFAAASELDADGERLARAVFDETAGNPFFVGEMIRHLVASGAVVHDGERWTLAQDLDELGLPEGVREVIGRRLSTLSPRANDILAVAAVAGPRFDASIVAEAMQAGLDEVLDACDEATLARLLVEGAAPGSYAFAHALVRQTLDAELTVARRTRWHRAIGLAIEAAPRAADNVGELARHFAACAPLGEHERALKYLRSAAELAVRDLAFEEAAALYARALDVAELVDDDPLRSCDLLTARGDALRRATDPAHRAVLFSAVPLAGGDGQRLSAIARALNPGEAMGTFQGVDTEVIAVVDAALAALDPEDSVDRARMLALLGVELSLAHDIEANERGRAAYRDGLAMARRLGDPRCLADVLAGFYVGIHGPDTFEELPLVGAELHRLADDLGDERLRLAGNVALMFSAFEHGDVDEGLEICAAHDALAIRVHSGYERWRAAFTRTTIAISERLELADAAVAIESAAALGVAGGVPETLVRGIALSHGNMHGLIVHPAWAHDSIDLQEAIAAGMPALRVVWAVAALAAVELGDVDRAQANLAHNTAAGFADYPRNFHWTNYLASNSGAAAAVGDRATCAVARSLLEPLRGRCTWSGAGLICPIEYTLGILEAALGEHAAAYVSFEQALARCARANLPRWAIETKTAHAKALVADPASTDADRARAKELATEARDTAAAAGAHRLAMLADRVLADPALAGG